MEAYGANVSKSYSRHTRVNSKPRIKIRPKWHFVIKDVIPDETVVIAHLALPVLWQAERWSYPHPHGCACTLPGTCRICDHDRRDFLDGFKLRILR